MFVVTGLADTVEHEEHDLPETLRRWANLLRLEGNYVGAQATERQVRSLGPGLHPSESH